MKARPDPRAVGFVLLFGLACGSEQRSESVAAFVDVAVAQDLRFHHQAGRDGTFFLPEIMGGGCALFDYDGDDDLDVYLVNGRRRESRSADEDVERNRLFRREANGRFTDVTDESGVGDEGYGMGCAVGDIDNDGDLDVYVTNYGPNRLYRNEGDGRFSDATAEAGLEDEPGALWSSSAAFFDYDGDGNLDLYVANYLSYRTERYCTDPAGRREYCGPWAFPGSRDVLYHNGGNGSFVDVSSSAGIAQASGRGLGVAPSDFNGDGMMDVYVANDGEPNFLWMNGGDGRFEERALIQGVAVNYEGNPEAGMGVAIGDFDGDLDQDVFVSHLLKETNTLYRYDGEWFEDDTAAAGLSAPSLSLTGFGTAFLDYDHDGDLDLAVANGRVKRGAPPARHRLDPSWAPYAEPNQLFTNDGGGAFTPLEFPVEAAYTAPEVSRGLAIGDLDGDGDLDMCVTSIDGPARLFRNDAPKRGHWLMVRAIDPRLKRDAFGSRVLLVAGGREQLREVNPAFSYLSSSDPRVHFGLGEASVVDRITVRWPDGQTETYPGGAADRVVVVRRGEGRPPT